MILQAARAGTCEAGLYLLPPCSHEPVTVEQASWLSTGIFNSANGRHKGGLNFGDCFACPLAKAFGEPLLFKGSDFTETVICSPHNMPSLCPGFGHRPKRKLFPLLEAEVGVLATTAYVITLRPRYGRPPHIPSVQKRCRRIHSKLVVDHRIRNHSNSKFGIRFASEDSEGRRSKFATVLYPSSHCG